MQLWRPSTRSLSILVSFVVAAMCSPIAAQTSGKRLIPGIAQEKQSPIGATEEARAAIKALRSIDAATSSGINYRDYSQEVISLTAALSALDEVLLERKAEELRTQVAGTLKHYQNAKAMWTSCRLSQDCTRDMINMTHQGISRELQELVRQYLRDYPSANVSMDDGGALIQVGEFTIVHNGSLLGAMWRVGGERNKALRASLRGE